MNVFVSHNKADQATAQTVAVLLSAEGIGTWFDEWEIAAGDSIIGRIEEGLGNASHFLIVWSANAARSNWVREELRAALSRAITSGSPRVVPVMLDDTPLPELLRDRKGVKWQGGTGSDWQQLVRGVTGHAPSGTALTALVKKFNELVRCDDEPMYLGYRACPKCGSEDLEPEETVDVDFDYADGEALPLPSFFWKVTCASCGWTETATQPHQRSGACPAAPNGV